MTEVLLPTTVVGSYPQPDWLIDRERLDHIRCRRCGARPELWRIAEAISWSRPRTTPRSSRSATWSAPASTSSPTARSGGKATPTVSRRRSDGIDLEQSGEITGAATARHRLVPRVVGPIRRSRPVEVRDVRVPAPQHRPDDQDHPARPVHHGAAGEERVLRGRRRTGDGLCRTRSTPKRAI